MNFMDLSSRTVSKILNRLGIKCFKCGWGEASCDVHHIIPKKVGGTDDPNNLTVLCPNCHRVAHAKDERDFPTFADLVGEEWKKHYFPEGTKNAAVRKQISNGMKKAHKEGRANSFKHVLTVKLESHSRLTLSRLEREDLGKEEIPFLNLFPLGE